MIKAIITAAFLLMISPAKAVEINTNVEGMIEYTYDKPMIYVFYNNTPCQACMETIKILEANYNQYYKDEFDFFVVNYENYPASEFKDPFNLTQPLTVILIKVKDGINMGTYRMDQLEASIDDPKALEINFRTAVIENLKDQN